MKYLLSDLVLKFLYVICYRHIPAEFDVLVWVLFILIQPILLSLAIKKLVHNPKIKIINFVVLVTSVCLLCNFLLEWFLYDYFKNISVLLNILLFLIIIPLSFNAIFRLFQFNNTPYNAEKTYLAYKKPKNFFGLVGSLINSPYGHCFLVTNGQKFYFSKGHLHEAEYIHNKNICLKKIRYVSLHRARDLIGTKWSIFNNCFTVFRRLNNV